MTLSGLHSHKSYMTTAIKLWLLVPFPTVLESARVSTSRLAEPSPLLPEVGVSSVRHGAHYGLHKKGASAQFASSLLATDKLEEDDESVVNESIALGIQKEACIAAFHASPAFAWRIYGDTCYPCLPAPCSQYDNILGSFAFAEVELWDAKAIQGAKTADPSFQGDHFVCCRSSLITEVEARNGRFPRIVAMILFRLRTFAEATRRNRTSAEWVWFYTGIVRNAAAKEGLHLILNDGRTFADDIGAMHDHYIANLRALDSVAIDGSREARQLAQRRVVWAGIRFLTTTANFLLTRLGGINQLGDIAATIAAVTDGAPTSGCVPLLSKAFYPPPDITRRKLLMSYNVAACAKSFTVFAITLAMRGAEYSWPVTAPYAPMKTGLTGFATAGRFLAIVKDTIGILKALRVSGWKLSRAMENGMQKQMRKFTYDSSALIMMWYVGFFQFFLLDATLTLADAWAREIRAAQDLEKAKQLKINQILNIVEIAYHRKLVGPQPAQSYWSMFRSAVSTVRSALVQPWSTDVEICGAAMVENYIHTWQNDLSQDDWPEAVCGREKFSAARATDGAALIFADSSEISVCKDAEDRIRFFTPSDATSTLHAYFGVQPGAIWFKTLQHNATNFLDIYDAGKCCEDRFYISACSDLIIHGTGSHVAEAITIFQTVLCDNVAIGYENLGTPRKRRRTS